MIGNLSKSKTLMGEKGEKGDPGISPIVTVEDKGNGYEVTIKDYKNVHTFYLKDGDKGEDGVSPIVNVTSTEEGHKIEITDKEGKKEFVIKDTEINPDSSQNDETAPDYIKNRTHYTEIKSVVHGTFPSSDGLLIINLTSDFNPQKKYKISVGDEIVEAVLKEDEDFYIQGCYMDLYYNETESYIVSNIEPNLFKDIYEEIIVPLPEKYIPDSIARVADVEEILDELHAYAQNLIGGDA